MVPKIRPKTTANVIVPACILKLPFILKAMLTKMTTRMSVWTERFTSARFKRFPPSFGICSFSIYNFNCFGVSVSRLALFLEFWVAVLCDIGCVVLARLRLSWNS